MIHTWCSYIYDFATKQKNYLVQTLHHFVGEAELIFLSSSSNIIITLFNKTALTFITCSYSY